MAKKDDSGLKWSHELVRQIGAAMQKARGKRTAKWLSERTAELGYRVSPTVIAKLDSGHRGNVLSVAELLVIADALEVPPAALLFPAFPMAKWSIFRASLFRQWMGCFDSPASTTNPRRNSPVWRCSPATSAK